MGIDKTRDHEKWLADPAGFVGTDAQPADGFAGDERVVIEAAVRHTADIPASAGYVESVGLERRAVIDCRLGIEDRLIHLELAEVGGPVTKPFQHGPHIGHVRAEAVREVVLHLIDDAGDLWRLAAEERRTGRRT